MSGSLEFITTGTASGVSGFTLDNIFSDKYLSYMVVVRNVRQANQNYLRLRLVSGSGVDSTSNYDYASLEILAGASPSEKKNTNQNVWKNSISYQGTGADDGAGVLMYIHHPFDSNRFTFVQSQSSAYYSGGGLGYKMIGLHQVEQSNTGLNFGVEATTDFDITVDVFGLVQ